MQSGFNRQLTVNEQKTGMRATKRKNWNLKKILIENCCNIPDGVFVLEN